MVRHEGNSLNTLFDELARWEDILQATSISKNIPKPEP